MRMSQHAPKRQYFCWTFFLTASMNHHEPLPVDKLNIAIEHGHLVC